MKKRKRERQPTNLNESLLLKGEKYTKDNRSEEKKFIDKKMSGITLIALVITIALNAFAWS